MAKNKEKSLENVTKSQRMYSVGTYYSNLLGFLPGIVRSMYSIKFWLVKFYFITTRYTSYINYYYLGNAIHFTGTTYRTVVSKVFTITVSPLLANRS
jgi:hypothetical protein